MWALVESGSISKIFTRPTQLTIGDIKYPRNIFEIWSESELKSIGIYTIVIDNTNLKDSNVYSDNSGKGNLGFPYSDFKPRFTEQTLKPKKIKNQGNVRKSNSNGAF